MPRRRLFLDPCGALRPAYASAGSTGVSLAMVAAAEGVRCHIAMPDDAALEKSQLLAALGANVQRVRPVSISHPGHFVNVARKVTPHLPLGSIMRRRGACLKIYSSDERHTESISACAIMPLCCSWRRLVAACLSIHKACAE